VTEALLQTNDARVDVGGAPQLDGLTLRTTGSRVVVLGAATALYDAVSGTRRPGRGTVLVHGEPADAALRATRVAGAPLDPAMPAAWTPRDYAQWSARLAGRDDTLAKRLADDAIDRLEMRAIADVALGKAAPHARRAAVLAGALATAAPVVVFADPTEGLPDAVARTFGRIVVAALAGRDWIAFAARMALSSPIALEAEEALVLAGSEVAAQGAPGELAASERTFSLKVTGDVQSLATAVEARGASVRRSASVLVVNLGESLTTRDLLSMALENHAVIVELSPLTRALG
jgi:ABC-type multidrug transport system ATPase subunit